MAGTRPAGLVLLATLLVATVAFDVPHADSAAAQSAPVGRCTRAAASAMPDQKGHDYLDITQHAFACRIRQVFFDGLADELAEQPDVVLGEMDVESGIAAVAVAYPESGVLFFDVANPAKPVFLSWYRGPKCETAIFDIDCGAYVDLSDDGQVAFLSVQSLSVLPGSAPDPGQRPAPEPGVEVLDIRDPTLPLMVQAYPVVSTGGVHTSRSFVVPEGSADDGPRAPGEYLFSIANGFGIEVTEVTRPGGVPQLTPVKRIDIVETHDMFLANDRLTGRTYMYVAGGYASGFYVYDVTDPAQEELLAEWDITPDCNDDWYAHTTDTVVRKGRRYVTIDAEIFDGGFSSTPSEKCGQLAGSSDKAGPLWIVDATDLEKLGPANAAGDTDNPALEQASKRAVMTTWTNPAGRAGGNLTFSPHNQQVVSNRIYLSNYHGGIYVLGARATFRRGLRGVRPTERGFIVPHGEETRPIYVIDPPPQMPFFSAFPPSRPEIWDMVYYRGYILAADMFGGFYSLQFDGDRARLARKARRN